MPLNGYKQKDYVNKLIYDNDSKNLRGVNLVNRLTKQHTWLKLESVCFSLFLVFSLSQVIGCIMMLAGNWLMKYHDAG